MAVSALDTHELVKDLKSAGFTDEQAEAVTRAVKRSHELDFSDLATKADVAALRADTAALGARLEARLDGVEARLEARLDGVEARLEARLDGIDARSANFVTKAELADTKTELIKWVVGIAFAQVAMILAILKLFPSGHP
jgi:hypothetical protein